MKTLLNLITKSLITESRLLCKYERPADSAFGKIEKVQEKAPLKLSEAKSLAEKALKEFTDKSAEWEKPDNGQSDTFRTKVGQVKGELNQEYETWKPILDVGGDAALEATKVPEFKTFGKKLETKLQELDLEAEKDRVVQKKEQLKTKVTELDGQYSDAKIQEEIDRKASEYTTTLVDEEPLKLKTAVTNMIKKNLVNFGANSKKALKAIKDGSLYKDIDKPDAVVKEADLDAAIKSLKDTNSFPADIKELWARPEGVALDTQTKKFIKAVESVQKGCEAIPSKEGSEAGKAKAAKGPEIKALLEKISKGSISAGEIIAERRQIETAIMIGFLRDHFAQDKEMISVIEQVFQNYKLGKWNNKVDQAKVKTLIEKIKTIQGPDGKPLVNIELEGGADSKEFVGLLESRYNSIYIHYSKAAARLLAIPGLQNDPYVKANQPLIEAISKITDKAGFGKFLQENNSIIERLKSPTGPFNTILAYMRMENVAGDSLVNVPDPKPTSIYLETGASDQKYRYSLVMTYNREAAPADPNAPAINQTVTTDPNAPVDPNSPSNRLVDALIPVDPTGKPTAFNGYNYTFDSSTNKYTITTAPNKFLYTRPLDKTEFMIAIGKEVPTEDYVKQKTTVTILKGKQGNTEYDPEKNEMSSTYEVDASNYVVITYDLITGKVRASEQAGDIKLLLKNTNTGTLALAANYGIDLAGIQPKDPDKDLQEAIQSKDYAKTMELLLKKANPNIILLAKCFAEVDLATITAQKDALSKIDLSKLVQVFIGEDFSDDLNGKILAIKGTPEITDQPLLNVILDSLWVKPERVAALFGQKENQANAKLINKYLTSEDAFQESDDSLKDVNMAIILAYKGKLMSLPENVIQFIADNADVAKEDQKKLLVKVLTEMEASNDLYRTMYDKMGYAPETMPEDPNLWGKYEIAGEATEIVVEMKNILTNPKAKDYLAAWLKAYTGEITVSIMAQEDADTAKKIATLLKEIPGQQSLYALHVVEKAILAFDDKYPVTADKDVAAKLLEVVKSPKTSDDEKLAAINHILDTDELKAAYLDADGNPTETIKDLNTKKADILYDKMDYSNVDVLATTSPRDKFIGIILGLDKTPPTVPTINGINDLISGKEIVGEKALVHLASQESLPKYYRTLLYKAANFEGSSAEMLGQSGENADDDAMLETLVGSDNPSNLDDLLKADQSGLSTIALEALIATALANHTAERHDKIMELLKSDKCSQGFTEETLEKFAAKFTAAQKMNIVTTKLMYKTALNIFAADSEVALSLENVVSGLAASGVYKLTIGDVLEVIKIEGKTLSHKGTSRGTAFEFYRGHSAAIEKYSPEEQNKIMLNLGLDAELVELGSITYKTALTSADVTRAIELAEKYKDQLPTNWLKIFDVATMTPDLAAAFAGWNREELQFRKLEAIDADSLKALMSYKGELDLTLVSGLDEAHYEALLERPKEKPYKDVRLKASEYNKFVEWYKVSEIIPESAKMEEIKEALKTHLEEEEGKWDFDQATWGDDMFDEDVSLQMFVDGLFSAMESSEYMPKDSDEAISIAEEIRNAHSEEGTDFFNYGTGADDEQNKKVEGTMTEVVGQRKGKYIEGRVEHLRDYVRVNGPKGKES